MATKRLLNSAGVKIIMNRRILVPESAVGKRVVFTVQGDGTVMDVKNKKGELVASIINPDTVFQKKIFNLQANSQLAMGLAINRETLKQAIAAEKAGQAEKAHELYNQYLNKVQISFNVPTDAAVVDKLASGVEIAAKVEKITTENGSFLTVDYKSMSVVEPERFGTTTFDIDSYLIDEEEEDEDDATTVNNVFNDKFAGMDRDALKAYIKANALEFKVSKNMSDDDIRTAIKALEAKTVNAGGDDEDDEF